MEMLKIKNVLSFAEKVLNSLEVVLTFFKKELMRKMGDGITFIEYVLLKQTFKLHDCIHLHFLLTIFSKFCLWYILKETRLMRKGSLIIMNLPSNHLNLQLS